MIEKKPEPVVEKEQPKVVAPVTTKPVEATPVIKKEEAPIVKEVKNEKSVEALSKPAAAGGEGDFKNSLAALIGRGKPTYKKPAVEEKKVEEAPKVKVDVFNNDSDDDEDGSKVNPHDAVTIAM